MSPDPAPLPRSFFDRDPVEVAPELLGAHLRVDDVVVRLTEVEAYRGQGEDPGSHSYRGRTPRVESMWGPPGHLYLYFTYGMHWCANLVCWPPGRSGAVLLRAGEVIRGHDLVAARRAAVRPRDWTRGPARLTKALALDSSDDGSDALGSGRVAVSKREALPPSLIRSGPRVGVSGPGGDAVAYPWRFWVDGEPSVSAYRPGRRGRLAPDPAPRHEGSDPR
ncbi:DNA-3-methyladenine glycosylase [Marihabitans asiaticum]|uniref:Putative 3-methyladenine DNA glycosylase n=1 Tax=Marihabitans asiaticum TaxID=415218 RepID=A0A560WAL9_9MICO|nr:DNA-3-methyladenine glycosylase [Marihabitans asiaticum]TWD14652.1 DNA-3-methyladenine glycosylase [Marihabitans asiaticum]